MRTKFALTKSRELAIMIHENDACSIKDREEGISSKSEWKCLFSIVAGSSGKSYSKESGARAVCVCVSN